MKFSSPVPKNTQKIMYIRGKVRDSTSEFEGVHLT